MFGMFACASDGEAQLVAAEPQQVDGTALEEDLPNKLERCSHSMARETAANLPAIPARAHVQRGGPGEEALPG